MVAWNIDETLLNKGGDIDAGGARFRVASEDDMLVIPVHFSKYK